jgi:hypothetical protein
MKMLGSGALIMGAMLNILTDAEFAERYGCAKAEVRRHADRIQELIQQYDSAPSQAVYREMEKEYVWLQKAAGQIPMGQG